MKFTPLLQKALNKAAFLHRKQKRKNDHLPYIVHPVSVTFILSEYTDDENTLAAALLHDVLEDVPNYGETALLEDFGPIITKIVKELSEDIDPNHPEDAKLTWQHRKQGYLAKLKTDSEEALLICSADKYHNLLSLREAYLKSGIKAFKIFHAPMSKQLWFYSEIIRLIKSRLNNPLIIKLENLFEEISLDIKKSFPQIF